MRQTRGFGDRSRRDRDEIVGYDAHWSVIDQRRSLINRQKTVSTFTRMVEWCRAREN